MNQSSISLVAEVVAVVVTYQPDQLRLGALLDAVAAQAEHVVVVDNGSAENVADMIAASGRATIHLISLGKNLGIAAAHNAGIAWARLQNAKYVMLMDQDSEPDTGMVAALKLMHEQLNAAGNKVAAIGPRSRDRQTGRLAPHVRFGGLRFAPVACDRGQQVVKTDLLISSGSLISLATLDALGGMDEQLFIDQVDTEWILRARARGYLAWGHCTATMGHSLGEWRRRVWLGRWREVPLHKPFRYYFMIRNSVLLQRRGYPCWAWRRLDAIRLLQMTVFVTMFHPQRWSALGKMLLGLRDGIWMRHSS